jgi:Tripartite tricarboxylate transporter family receptor
MSATIGSSLGDESNGSFGIVAPANTSADVIAKLNAAFVKVLNDPDIVRRIRELGAEPLPMTPAEFDADGDVGIGGKIAIDLERIGINAEQEVDAFAPTIQTRVYLVQALRRTVCVKRRTLF